jgi:hypothetical protein
LWIKIAGTLNDVVQGDGFTIQRDYLNNVVTCKSVYGETFTFTGADVRTAHSDFLGSAGVITVKDDKGFVRNIRTDSEIWSCGGETIKVKPQE